MFSKLPSAEQGKSLLGLILFVPGLCLQFFPPRHSLHYAEIGLVLMMVGVAFWYFGTYFFLPLMLFIAALVLDRIPQVNHQVSQVLESIALALGFWGAWRVRKAKIAQKKLN